MVNSSSEKTLQLLSHQKLNTLLDITEKNFYNYFILIYYCLHCFLFDIPLMNVDAVIQVWGNIDAFHSFCLEKTNWTQDQTIKAQIVFILYQ
jgi:hypothetical protein